MSRKLVLAGAGSLNRQVAAQWSPFGSVEAMRLSEPDPSLGFSQVSVDLAEQRWPDLAGDCLVVALASRGERTVENYRRAYLQPIQQLQASLSQWRNAPDRIVVVSSSRVYGVDDGRWIDDDTSAASTDERARILLEMETQAHALPCPVSVVRLSGIYGPGRDWLKRRALAAEQGALQDSWTNRIHIEDAARAIVHILNLPDPEPHYIVSDQQPQTLSAMFNFFREAEGLAPLQGEPEPGSGKRLKPARLQASGFEWRYPTAFSGGYDV